MGVNPASQRELFVEVLSGSIEMKGNASSKSLGLRSVYSGALSSSSNTGRQRNARAVRLSLVRGLLLP